MWLFGRKKMYKKGLTDAMQAYEAFGKKQEEALAFMREEVRSGNKELKDALAGLGEDLNGIYQYLTAQEKAALYQLSTPIDIKELDDAEKRLLLAVLYQLAENEGNALTDDQRAYIRSVQKYLEITNPQTFSDLSVIENIDSIDVQKTLFRMVLEFFCLQESHKPNDKQMEIFDYFSINPKQAVIIENEVRHLFNAVGSEGIVEKYGYISEEEYEIIDEGTESSEDSHASDFNCEFEDFEIEEFLTRTRWRNNIIETDNYILSYEPDFKRETLLRLDKRTKTSDLFCASYSWYISSLFNFCSHQTNAKAFGDKIIWYDRDEDAFYILDVSTMPQPPYKLFSPNCPRYQTIDYDFNEEIIAYYHDMKKEMCYYSLSEKELVSVPLDSAMCVNGADLTVIGRKIYFVNDRHNNNYWSNSLVCYDTDSDSFTRIGDVPYSYIESTAWVGYQNKMFLHWDGYKAFKFYYVDLFNKKLYFHELYSHVGLSTSFYSIKDGLLFVDETRDNALLHLNFLNATITKLATQCSVIDFICIGNWVYYTTTNYQKMKVCLNDPLNSIPFDASNQL